MQHLELLPIIHITEPISLSVILAYLDPGSGSFIIQLLIAGAAGILFTFRGYWSSLINKITGKQKEEDTETTDNNESGE
jgi:hypothetical protein